MRERFFFFFQAEDGIRDVAVTGVQTCALPILKSCSRLAFLDCNSLAGIGLVPFPFPAMRQGQKRTCESRATQLRQSFLRPWGSPCCWAGTLHPRTARPLPMWLSLARAWFGSI